MATTVSYTLRIPSDLKRFLEIHVEKRGGSVASIVTRACWDWLEKEGRPANQPMGAAVPVRSGVDHLRPSDGAALADCNSAVPAKPDMQALHEITSGRLTRAQTMFSDAITPYKAPYESQEIAICGKTWWEDGEHFECLMDAGHRELKHGLRGMVRRMDQ